MSNSPESSTPKQSIPARFPKWLRQKLPLGKVFSRTDGTIKNKGLPTVCEEASCPNRTHCWSRHTATYLALGDACTRRCGFCDIDFTKKPLPPDPQEGEKIAASAKALGLKHIVITMVSRDDLEDGGADALARIITTLHIELPEATIEVLASDFEGNIDALHHLLDARIAIYNHNVETVERLSPLVRHKATYRRSLMMLEQAAQYLPDLMIKSGIMVGLGEQESEIKQTLKDLADHGVKIVTIGQYLRPSRRHIPVKSYVSPETFDYYRSVGEALGLFIYAGPFVRSSFNADAVFEAMSQRERLSASIQ
ncbi:lipoyl synthase [Chlamydia muridarum str. Nigg]|jgi:lipoate synthase|uniref:Lipoyl synthase n=2 Tax=Chlamydia muridarum TaxID=83560 RepID=LIPA_CHLMU|nr:lipoyl synthase [Chlamydia muridarum]Q9PJI2.1 RecName: Full=Lipoyl synthase; AltName: Full=Lip-syn; Short=LS; AltName: Full=Lipoate synthase; AltName: Full=Lipoic acid synthase; AltName: Full=Sulfur insertion protein LipA [Chlamydia muridarum str. Nigg]UFT55260.1 lipoyl synthase [Chlamydia trachomatis]AAF39645.1 lipoic acid synthetase [Chlamydia muridarum str. Nigg]AHH23233.1 lipoyl synthase [Chlamydia muridarum str. Nigg3 CMUT3-5]AHH24159.1 lipoyl synthase [Chlamydia muridarum str. Nigg CM